MALRRPPTSITLKPSDVSDLREFIQQRDELAKEVNQELSTSTSGGGGGGKDALVEQEKRDREEREGKGQRGRIVG